MIWIATGIIVYLAIGVVIIGFWLGSSKTSGGWSPRMAWEQLTNDGLRGIWFWVVLTVGWFPIGAMVITRSWWEARSARRG